MQTPALNHIKKTLLALEPNELTAICLRLAKYKKENKELLAYLLFESSNEAQYIEDIRLELDALFDELRFIGVYKFTKQVRKILRYVNKHIKYSGNPATEVELLIYFCQKLYTAVSGKNSITAIQNLYYRQIDKIEKTLLKLHEDLRFDFQNDIEELKSHTV